MTLINQIKDVLKKDSDTKISIPLHPSNKNRSLGNYEMPDKSILQPGMVVKRLKEEFQRDSIYSHEDNHAVNDVTLTQKEPFKRQQKIQKPVIRRRKTEDDGTTAKDLEQSAAPALILPNTTPLKQQPVASSAQDEDVYQKLKSATNQQRVFNNYISESQRTQKNNLKFNDDSEIQRIRNELVFNKPTPIAENVGVNSELPPNVLPPEWMALLYCFAAYLNVPVIALISGLLASICIATLGRFKIEVEKDLYYEAFTLYFIVVMLSGAKKSAIVQLFKSIFDNLFEELQVEHDAKAPDPKLLKELYEKNRKKLVKDLSNEVAPNDISEINRRIELIGKDLAPLKDKMKNSYSRPNLFNDSSTMKKLAVNMAQQNEFTAIFEAEGGILKHCVRANETDILLKGHTMEYFGRETATNGSVIMQHPCLTICSYIQPGVAFKLYSKDDLKDDGLLPRILPVFCLSKQGIQHTIPQGIDPELMAMYEAKITSVLEYCSKKGTDE